jgi:hypothetical protein
MAALGKYEEAEVLFNEIKLRVLSISTFSQGGIRMALKLLKDMEPKWNQSSLAFLQYYTLRAQALYGKGLLQESAPDLSAFYQDRPQKLPREYCPFPNQAVF